MPAGVEQCHPLRCDFLVASFEKCHQLIDDRLKAQVILILANTNDQMDMVGHDGETADGFNRATIQMKFPNAIDKRPCNRRHLANARIDDHRKRCQTFQTSNRDHVIIRTRIVESMQSHLELLE